MGAILGQSHPDHVTAGLDLLLGQNPNSGGAGRPAGRAAGGLSAVNTPEQYHSGLTWKLSEQGQNRCTALGRPT